MRNYPLCQKLSENTHVSTEKEKFPTSFLHFAFFSKLVFCVSKNSFTPLISAISSPIGLKFFLVRLQTIWVGRFFFFWIPCTNQVWQVSQTLGGPKNLEILQSAQYFSSPAWTISNFWKKKRSPRLGPSIYSKIFSSNGWNLWICRGETFCKFLTLGSLEVHEDDVWQICVYDNFCSTTRGLSTLKISGIFAGPFPRNAGKGGGSP